MAIDFVTPLTAGTVLVRSDIRSQNYVAGSAGWIVEADGDAEFNAVTIRGGTVVGGVALYYSGTPAAGNLIMSISATAGTDAFGNAYLAGAAVYGTSDRFTARSSTGDTAVLRADAPSGISATTAPGLELKLSSGDVTAASLTEFDDTFTRGLYLRTSSPLNIASSLAGVDYAAVQMEGRFHGSDPQIKMYAGDPVDAPAGGIWLNGTFLNSAGGIEVYGEDFGSWAVTVGNSGGATFSASSSGSYMRFGKLWFVQIYLVVAGAGAGAGIVTVDVPFTVDRSKRQTLTMHTESTGPGGSHIGNGTCTFFVGGSGGTADRLRTSSNSGTNADANITGADLLVGGIITIQGWLRED